MRRLPAGERDAFRRPFGEVFPDIPSLLPRLAGRTVYTVGDVVTHHLVRQGITPAVAIIDGHTMREPCAPLPDLPLRRLTAANPAGTISDPLVAAIRDALERPPALVFVEGEEDLAVIPLVLAAPEGGIVLYGQPGHGVVLRVVDAEAKRMAREFLGRFVRDPGSR